jgi:hypothetical protein
MIEINYQFLQEMFDKVWENANIRYFTYGLKGVAIAFLLLRYVFIVVKQQADAKEIQLAGSNTVKVPITIWNLGYYAFIVLCIVGYDKFLFVMDNLWGYFVSYFASFETKSITINLEKTTDVTTDASVWETMKTASYEFLKFISNPALMLLTILKPIIWLADMCISVIFIGERFFILLILKLTGPVILCLSLIPKFGGMLGKWLTLYARWYLLIIPYFLVNFVINTFIDSYNVMFGKFGAGSSFPMEHMRDMLMVPLFLILIVLKFKLYSTGKRLYEQLIDINIRDDE